MTEWVEAAGGRLSTLTSECVHIPRWPEQREPWMRESHKVCMSWWALTHTHTHTVRSHGNKRLKLADSPKYIAGCLYCPSYLFSSHRQHAAALLHSDWLVLGPRAERSRTQAAEQVESQDRRGQRSLQGQTGVRPGHNRPPLELTQPANRLAPSTPQSSDGWNWASNLPLNAKGAFICPSEAPGSVWGDWPLFWFSFFFFLKSQRWKKEKSKRKFSLHFNVSYKFLGKNKSACMSSCFGQTSQWDTPVRVHDVTAEENLFPSFLKCLSDLEYCSHISQS